MSEANPPSPGSIQRKLSDAQHLTTALLELFELVVATTREEPVFDRLAEWADEHKPRLERIVRNAQKP